MDLRSIVCAVRPALRRRVEAWLPKRGMRHASTAEEALLWAAEGAPDLVVWDLDSEAFGRAPLEALRRIRPLEPVLALEPGRGPPRAVFLGGLCVLSGRLDGESVRSAAAGLARPRRGEDELQPDAEVLRTELRRLAWLSRSLDALPVAVTLVDEGGQVLEANAEARRLARRRATGPCCKFWRCRIPPERCPVLRVLESGRSVKRNLIEREPGAGERFLIERVSALVDPVSGRRVAALVTGPATGYVERRRRLLRQARVDPLTRLLNRRRFDELCRLAVRDRRAGPSAFLMIDVDGLKAVNDRHGHEAGDRVLSRLAAVLSCRTRQGDLVARVGGDEFAVRCPHTTVRQASELVRRLRRALRADNQRHPGEPPVSASIGLACSRGSGAALRALADRRLRQAKRRRLSRGAARPDPPPQRRRARGGRPRGGSRRRGRSAPSARASAGPARGSPPRR